MIDMTSEKVKKLLKYILTPGYIKLFMIMNRSCWSLFLIWSCVPDFTPLRTLKKIGGLKYLESWSSNFHLASTAYSSGFSLAKPRNDLLEGSATLIKYMVGTSNLSGFSYLQYRTVLVISMQYFLMDVTCGKQANGSITKWVTLSLIRTVTRPRRSSFRWTRLTVHTPKVVYA